jgi:hypothetical protein
VVTTRTDDMRAAPPVGGAARARLRPARAHDTCGTDIARDFAPVPNRLDN